MTPPEDSAAPLKSAEDIELRMWELANDRSSARVEVLEAWGQQREEVGRQEAEEAYRGTMTPDARQRYDEMMSDPHLFLMGLESMISRFRGVPAVSLEEARRELDDDLNAPEEPPVWRDPPLTSPPVPESRLEAEAIMERAEQGPVPESLAEPQDDAQ